MKKENQKTTSAGKPFASIDGTRDDNGFLSANLTKWTAHFRKELAPWVKLYKQINRFGHTILPAQVSHATTPRVLAWALYLRVLTSYQAALFLAERGLDAECKTILRSLAEAAFSINAIDKDEQFASKLLKANDYGDLQWMKKWNELNRGQDERLQNKINLLSNSVSKRDKLSVCQIAQAADMLNVYYAQYSGLCMHGHPTPHSAARRLRRNTETNSIATHLLPMADDANDNLRLGMMFMLFGLKAVFNIFQFPGVERVLELHNRFTELCATLQIFDLRTSQMMSEGRLFIQTNEQ